MPGNGSNQQLSVFVSFKKQSSYDHNIHTHTDTSMISESLVTAMTYTHTHTHTTHTHTSMISEDWWLWHVPWHTNLRHWGSFWGSEDCAVRSTLDRCDPNTELRFSLPASSLFCCMTWPDLVLYPPWILLAENRVKINIFTSRFGVDLIEPYRI